MVSRILVIASSRVLPCEMQPGEVGQSATNTPSSSGSINTRNFMRPTIFAIGGPLKAETVSQSKGRDALRRRALNA